MSSSRRDWSVHRTLMCAIAAASLASCGGGGDPHATDGRTAHPSAVRPPVPTKPSSASLVTPPAPPAPPTVAKPGRPGASTPKTTPPAPPSPSSGPDWR